jgi:hypothetical protein
MKHLRSVTLAVCLAALGSLSLQAADVTGSGTTNKIPIWTSSSAIGNSVMTQSGGNVGVSTASPAHPLDVTGDINSSAGYMIGGFLVLSASSTDSTTAVGIGALEHNSGATASTAVGQYALETNTTGGDNVALGFEALEDNATGNYNTGLGAFALQANTASNNTAVGYEALGHASTGGNNVAVGYDAGLVLTTGANNVAVGYEAGGSLTTGANNVAVGYQAGNALTTSNSNNIDIGNTGTSGDSGVIRIGGSNQTTFYAAGIYGVTTGTAAVEVFADASGQLGTKSSSIRFKEDVHDMGDASDRLLQLRPVTYRYKQPYADGSKPVDYGLIAEEVAQVYPDLVVRGADGQIDTVQYQKLTPMLLNEVQKQAETIRLLEKRLAALEAK